MHDFILIHGAWGGAWVFDGLLDRLRRAGHRDEAIDPPGHGGSQVPIPEVTMEAYVARVVEAVQASEEPVVLVGHSLAGAVISSVAEDITDLLLRDVEAPSEFEAAVEALQVQQAVEPFLAPARLTEERFGAVAKFYVRAALDRVMSAALQDRMASAWKLERVFTLESGHFPLISEPQRRADVLVEIAELELART